MQMLRGDGQQMDARMLYLAQREWGHQALAWENKGHQAQQCSHGTRKRVSLTPVASIRESTSLQCTGGAGLQLQN